MIRRTRLAYGFLLAVWALIIIWQAFEHGRVKSVARTALLNRSRDITTTLGLVIRSQRRFGGVVSQERLESALKELVKSGELSSIAMLNAAGEVVASAGSPVGPDPKTMMQAGVRWEDQRVMVMNLVDLGVNENEEGQAEPRTIVLPKRDPTAEPREEPRPRPRSENWPGPGEPPNGPPKPPPDGSVPPPGPPAGPPRGPFRTNRNERAPGDRERPRSRWGRPWWMNEEEYQALLEKRGFHGLFIAMSTEAFRRATVQDLWMRWMICCFAGVSAVGLGLAWRSLAKSSELQLRLLRASELTTHLKEMNLAAAGLAHETRNPLNIVRGLAQIISKQEDASPEIRKKSREIIDETDRVTAQLSEFINYSRPRDIRPAPVALNQVVGEVTRALSHDLEEKQIQLRVAEEPWTVEADEPLLRQVLFNLLLNAVQAVAARGEIQVLAGKGPGSEVFLEVRDNGPGIPADRQGEIFKPYFTTHEKGTGLGLAIVQQIILAHGWEIECLPNQPRGAVFRITHLKPVSRSADHDA
jgi:signal transduction histidine kinase